MDDPNLSPWVGAVALGMMLTALAAVTWLLVSLSPGPSGGDLRVGDRQVSRPPFAHHRLPDQMQRCIDADAGRGVSGCVAASSAPPTPPTPSVHRVQRSTRPGAVGVTPPPTQVPSPSAPATLQASTVQVSVVQQSTPQQSTPQPSAPQPSAPQPSAPPPAPTRQPLPHNGPVPGGNTSPPHTGPRP
jgi:hypothetical protein